MKTFLKRYRNLEQEVFRTIREKILKSTIRSEFVNTKCLQVDYENVVEVAIIDDRLKFINNNGNYFDIYSLPLEDLIRLLKL